MGAAEYSGAKIKNAANFVFGETNVSKEFLAKFPSGKVPAFESDDGLCLFESNAIAYYVANDQLRGGKDAVAQCQVLQWLNFADSDILPASCTPCWRTCYLGGCSCCMHNDKSLSKCSRSWVQKAFWKRKSVVYHYCQPAPGEKKSLEPSNWLKKCPNLMRKNSLKCKKRLVLDLVKRTTRKKRRKNLRNNRNKKRKRRKQLQLLKKMNHYFQQNRKKIRWQRSPK